METGKIQRIAADLDCIEQLEAASGGWSLDFYQLDGGRLETEFEQIGSERVILSRVRFSRTLDQRGSSPDGLLTFGFLETGGPGVRWCGREAGDRALLNFNGTGGFESVSRPGHHGFTFSFTEDHLAAVARAVGAGALEQCRTALSVARSFSTDKVDDLNDLARRLIESSRRDPALLTSRRFRERFEFELPYRLISALASTEPDRSSYSSRQRAIEKACALIEDRLGDPPAVRELCKHAGVSWRTLDYAFREHFDMTPQAYGKAVRLDRARRLIRADSHATIALAASDCGFRHMSKFAVDYRRHFGERPSDTLRALRR